MKQDAQDHGTSVQGLECEGTCSDGGLRVGTGAKRDPETNRW